MKTLYVCNRNNPECDDCYEECYHTTNIKYSLYNDHPKDNFININDEERWELIRKNGKYYSTKEYYECLNDLLKNCFYNFVINSNNFTQEQKWYIITHAF